MSVKIKQIAASLLREYVFLKKRAFPYKPQAVLGPEHEFSIVDEKLKPLPIADKVIRDWLGKSAEIVYTPRFAFGKENVLHQIEIKAKKPFKSPGNFEETIHKAVLSLLEFVKRKYNACLLGTGMHPMLTSEQTGFWPHFNNLKTMGEFGKIFNLKSQGWLNIQSFQLNLPYYNEQWAIALYNALAHLCSYLPAISASSPICEGKLSQNIDTRLHYYGEYMQEIPSIAGEIVPEYITSFEQFRRDVIGKYSKDLKNLGVGERYVNAEWLNQRSVIFKFSRNAIEVRVMDEQECIKSDVALSCFIRATIRGLIAKNSDYYPPHQLLVNDYKEVVKNGLTAQVQHPQGKTAKDVCQYFLKIALEHGEADEKNYFWVVKRRIEEGNLSEIIRKRVLAKAQKTSFSEAIRSIYTQLTESLSKNQPYF